MQSTVCPMRLHPHIFPYLAWIITEKEVVTVIDAFLGEDFLPLETVLRYYSSNIDYDSQVIHSFIEIHRTSIIFIEISMLYN